MRPPSSLAARAALLLLAASGLAAAHKCSHAEHGAPTTAARVEAYRTGGAAAAPGGAGAHEAASRRRAASSTAAPIRIHTDLQLDGVAADKKAFLERLVPVAVQELKRHVNVRTPVSGNLKLPRLCESQWCFNGDWNNNVCSGETKCAQVFALGKCNSATEPAAMYGDYETCDNQKNCATTTGGAGVADADFIIHVTAVAENYCSDGDTLAIASACSFDPTTMRPLSGSMNFCPNNLDPSADPTSSDGAKTHAWGIQLDTAVHEILHALVFTEALFAEFRGSDGVTKLGLSNVVGTYTKPVGTVKRIITPTVRDVARAQYGCSTLEGADLEDQGGESTANSHWEWRDIFRDLMVGEAHTSRQYFTNFTLALLEDSGWYRANWAMADASDFGSGAGCAFADDSCAAPLNAAFDDEYCGTTGSVGCTHDHIAVGQCVGQRLGPGNCARMEGYSNRVCVDPTQGTSNEAFFGQSYGLASRCLGAPQEEMAKDGWSYATGPGPQCYKMKCTGSVSGGDLALKVTIPDCTDKDNCLSGDVTTGAKDVVCPEGGYADLTTAGFTKGKIGPCPNTKEMCQWMGCKNSCFFRGVCWNPEGTDGAGTCQCAVGFAGEDCGTAVCTPSSCPSGQTCSLETGVCMDGSNNPQYTTPDASTVGGEVNNNEAGGGSAQPAPPPPSASTPSGGESSPSNPPPSTPEKGDDDDTGGTPPYGDEDSSAAAPALVSALLAALATAAM